MTKSNMRPVETENINPKVQSMSRRHRRVIARGRHVSGHTGRAPRRTGQPEWFRQMKWETERRKLLSKLPVGELAKYGICTKNQVKALEEAELRTVWAVVNATYEQMRAVRGFGPATLGKLYQDAKIKGQLTMNWKP